MPLYGLICDRCEARDDYFMGVNDGEVEVPCEACGAALTRHANRDYHGDRIEIRGDTCAGSCDFSNYFDDGLDMHIRSKSHRAEVMKKRGLTEYEPTTEGKAARKESAYIRANAAPNDPVALHAARQQSRDMDGKRKKRIITAATEKARRSLDKA